MKPAGIWDPLSESTVKAGEQGGVWMGYENGLWAQIQKWSLKLVDFNVLYKLTN